MIEEVVAAGSLQLFLKNAEIAIDQRRRLEVCHVLLSFNRLVQTRNGADELLDCIRRLSIDRDSLLSANLQWKKTLRITSARYCSTTRRNAFSGMASMEFTDLRNSLKSVPASFSLAEKTRESRGLSTSRNRRKKARMSGCERCLLGERTSIAWSATISENPLLSSFDYMEATQQFHLIQVAQGRGDGSTPLRARVEDVLVHVQTVRVQTAQEGDRPFFWTLGERRRKTIRLVVEFFVKRLRVNRSTLPNSVCELDEAAPCIAAVEEGNGVELETVRLNGRGSVLTKRIGNHREGTDQPVHIGLN